MTAVATPLLEMPAQVTLENAHEVAESLVRQVQSCLQATPDCPVITLRLHAVASFDSALVAVLLEVRRAVGSSVLACTDAPAKLRDLAGLYGVGDILFPSTAQ